MSVRAHVVENMGIVCETVPFLVHFTQTLATLCKSAPTCALWNTNETNFSNENSMIY